MPPLPFSNHATTKRPSPVRKRSLYFGAKSTSVSMEDEFWEALTEIARSRGVSRVQVVREVEERRTAHNLSSALRIFILEYYRKNRPSIESVDPLSTQNRRKRG